jgi:C_GCAxxG_C_C family probable redox protein
MGIYSDNAVHNFKQGYNCAQSVFLAFAEDFGFDKETALKLSSSFGGGMGRLREVCGAVSSMFAIAGLKYGYIEPNNDEMKAKHYEFIQSLAEKFKSKYGTIICRELLELPEGADSPIPSKRTEEYYQIRPCEAFVRYAAEIIENEILD